MFFLYTKYGILYTYRHGIVCLFAGVICGNENLSAWHIIRLKYGNDKIFSRIWLLHNHLLCQLSLNPIIQNQYQHRGDMSAFTIFLLEGNCAAASINMSIVLQSRMCRGYNNSTTIIQATICWAMYFLHRIPLWV